MFKIKKNNVIIKKLTLLLGDGVYIFLGGNVMLKIGDFSKMSKVTIKALRYYEKEGLLIPKYVDKFNGYRYYESNQLLEISRIIYLKQIGLTIDEIKQIIIKNKPLNELLKIKKKELENTIFEYNKLSKINYLLEKNIMKEEIFEKVVPAYYVYYKEGVLKNCSEASKFILNSATECMKLNPNIKCVEPDYCYINYLDGEYKENNIKVRYVQAVIDHLKKTKVLNLWLLMKQNVFVFNTKVLMKL